MTGKAELRSIVTPVTVEPVQPCTMTLDTVPATHWSTLLVLVTGKLAPARQEAAMDVKTLYRTLHLDEVNIELQIHLSGDILGH